MSHQELEELVTILMINVKCYPYKKMHLIGEWGKLQDSFLTLASSIKKKNVQVAFQNSV